MDAYTRIHALLREGKITAEEAELLLAALDGEPDGAREELRWAHVRMGAGNLEITQDPALDEPRVEGAATQRRLLRVHLPAGWGVVLEEAVGNVEADRLPYLKGSLRAGNLELGSGNVELALRAGSSVTVEGSRRRGPSRSRGRGSASACLAA